VVVAESLKVVVAKSPGDVAEKNKEDDLSKSVFQDLIYTEIRLTP
jgi:hypothetical protein